MLSINIHICNYNYICVYICVCTYEHIYIERNTYGNRERWSDRETERFVVRIGLCDPRGWKPKSAVWTLERPW